MTCPFCLSENDDTAETCIECGRGLFSLIRGAVLSGRYEVLGALGRGGMGLVYKAHDRELDETVAIKVLRPGLALSSDMAKRLRSEIKLARRVRHPNVCGIHEYGQDGHLRYIVMECIDGVDLKQILRQTGALDTAEAYAVSIQVAEGLQAIHNVGIVHRDLKTPNIMRDGRGLVRLMDFGLAKQYGDDAASGATATGMVIGTPEYMSPEQARAEKVDARSDIYALGVVIYELFTGEVPFRAETPLGTLLKHLHDAPPFEGQGARRLPLILKPILAKALAKDRNDRFDSARAVADALREAGSQSVERVRLEAFLPATRGATAPAVEAAPETTPLPTPVPTRARSAIPEETTPVPTPAPRVTSVPEAELARPVSASPLEALVELPAVAPEAEETHAPVAETRVRAAEEPRVPLAEEQRVLPPGPMHEGGPPTSRLTWVAVAVAILLAVGVISGIRRGPASPPGSNPATADATTPLASGTSPAPVDAPTPRPNVAAPPTPSGSKPAQLAVSPSPSPVPPPSRASTAPPRAAPSSPAVVQPAPPRREEPRASTPARTEVAVPTQIVPAPAPPVSLAASPTPTPEAKPSALPPVPQPHSPLTAGSPSPLPSAAATPSSSPHSSMPSRAEPPGVLAVKVKPSAEVLIDGKPMGRTPLEKIALVPGLHVVLLRHPDFEPFRRSVNIRAGETFALVVDLKDEAIRRKR